MKTVRRDLTGLERMVFEKVHGGAVRCEQCEAFNELPKRLEENNNEKQLAQTALNCINENDVIGIDSGSTAVALQEK